MSTNAQRIAFVGGGNMARSLIGGLARRGADPATLAVSEPNADLRDALARDFGIAAYADNAQAVHGAGAVVVAVKPQVMKPVLTALTPALSGKPLVISIAAGVRIDQIDAWGGGDLPIVRAMPNTPALIGAGATGLTANARVGDAERAAAERILGAAGLTVWIEREDLMDVVTAISGSAPAYFFLLVEALEAAAVAHGLPADAARALATQTALGAGRMLREDGETPARLRERVTSPNGTTQAALDAFAAGGFRELVARAVDAATTRGRELSAGSEN
jgi:pyrroline-5-carboxylate reductase